MRSTKLFVPHSITLQNVNKLDLMKLAPGRHIGRFCIWRRAPCASWTAFIAKTSSQKLTILPMHKMTNTDLSRILKSDEVHKALGAPQHHIAECEQAGPVEACSWWPYLSRCRTDREHPPQAGWSLAHGARAPHRRLTTSITLQNVNKLDLMKLAPGGHIGRFCIWTGHLPQAGHPDVLYGARPPHRRLTTNQGEDAEAQNEASQAEACCWSHPKAE
ncbi:uncharacterized protein LOC134093647 [Sardina pilchardus]|uniref:uncharacterized protein LOC134093647 n=1 Tax=Sardina pilchardus TaxID=27697 RepID=UPI002E157154